MELTKLNCQRTADVVYQALREGILNGAFKPGGRLSISEIASQLGVSLTPVRSALQMLATEGLIENRPRIGTYVASLSVRDIEENFEVRCALECLAAETAVTRLSKVQLQRLRELLRILSEPAGAPDARSRHQCANSELHLTLVEASGNKLLADLYGRLHANLIITRLHSSYGHQLSRLQQEQAEHEAILAAVEQRDATELKEALRKHIHRAKESLISDLKKSADTPA
ncbi:MAG: GntR family transcriptional regulator [Terriglobia bacterium]